MYDSGGNSNGGYFLRVMAKYKLGDMMYDVFDLVS